MEEEEDPRKYQIPLLLDQIAAILKLVEENRNQLTGPLTLDLTERINQLGRAVKKFKELNNQVYKEAEINMDKLTRDTLKNPNLDAETRQVLIRERQLEERAKHLKNELEETLEKLALGPKQAAQPEGLKMKKRRQKFKRLGANKDWKPL